MRVFNVPSSAPFLRTVVAALVDGKLVEGFSAREHPERLADVTLYLPTRRAGRLARHVFLDVLNTDAVLLPRIVTLGNIDEDDAAFADADIQAAFDLPPALGDLERRLLLSQMIGAWAKTIKPDDPVRAPLVIGGPASTLALADDLARLMDDFAARGVEWTSLDNLVPNELDVYWQYTFKFLTIAKDVWPNILKAHDKIEPMERINRLMKAETERLATQHKGPIIAAGSTGSRPASAMLLNAIAKLPQGAVVLPGLDTDLDEAAWRSIGGIRGTDSKFTTTPAWSHPQFALNHLLHDVFRITRADVKALAEPSANGREILTSEAMRPASASADWNTQLAKPEIAEKIAGGMARLAVIEAANPEMEALAIAVAMREAREEGMTAALVTPDRALARRVMAALGRWNLDFDDSGGDSLMNVSAGIFARLAAETVAKEFAPATLLALLKHPLFRLGAAKHTHKKAIADLELALLRGPRPASGSAGLVQAFVQFRGDIEKFNRGEASSIHRSEPRSRLNAGSLVHVEALIEKLSVAFAPLEAIKPDKPHDLTAIAKLHRDLLIALSCDDTGTSRAFENADGLALASAFDELFQNGASDEVSTDAPSPSGLLIKIGDYPDVFEIAFGGTVVRGPQSSSAQLRIYGLLEARLTTSERVILGGLVEGVWPPQPRVDPWLSRPMRHDLELDLPERRIGLSAHDFVQLLGADDVILSYAAKAGGAPSVASRFLHRLEAVAGKKSWGTAKTRGDSYVRFADELDHPADVAPAPQPMPKPSLALRPLRMSVTEIEHWLRDPYTIYAKHILKLVPLDPVDMPLTAADRGSAIHEALGEFTKAHAKTLPPDAAAVLRQYGLKHFTPLMERPEAKALWWPRFLRIASWFAVWEEGRRAEIKHIDAETSGALKIPLDNNREFTLTARADRIEHRADGTFAILDYKTGLVPTGRQVRIGLAPQLTLEAAILRGGGFKTIPAKASVSELLYVRLSGNNPPGEAKPLELKVDRSDQPQLPDDAADDALQNLTARIRKFEDETQAYPSLSLPMWSNRYGDYDDLARVKEWSAVGGKGGGRE